jgi:hypothetical protein
MTISLDATSRISSTHRSHDTTIHLQKKSREYLQETKDQFLTRITKLFHDATSAFLKFLREHLQEAIIEAHDYTSWLRLPPKFKIQIKVTSDTPKILKKYCISMNQQRKNFENFLRFSGIHINELTQTTCSIITRKEDVTSNTPVEEAVYTEAMRQLTKFELQLLSQWVPSKKLSLTHTDRKNIVIWAIARHALKLAKSSYGLKENEIRRFNIL